MVRVAPIPVLERRRADENELQGRTLTFVLLRFPLRAELINRRRLFNGIDTVALERTRFPFLRVTTNTAFFFALRRFAIASSWSLPLRGLVACRAELGFQRGGANRNSSTADPASRLWLAFAG